jgi:hypothetical protein
MGYKNKELQHLYAREHYLDNKDEYYWKCKLNRVLNPEITKQKRKEYYFKHKEEETENKKRWRKNNPEKYRTQNKKSWERRKEYENCVRRLKRKIIKMDVEENEKI